MSADEAPRRQGKRRPGRIRRWVVRPFVWGLVLLLVLLTGLWLLAASPFARERLRGLLIASGSQALGRRIALRAVEVDLFPPALVLHDAVVPGPGPGDPPVLAAPYVRVTFGLSLLRRRIVDLEQIEARSPRLYLQIHGDGTTNLPRLRRGGKKKGPLEVRIGRVLVEDGTLQLNEQELPLAVDARGIRGRVSGQADRGGRGGERLDVLAYVEEAVTSLPEARPYSLAVRLRGSLWPREARARFERIQLSGDDVQARLQGTVSWRGAPNVELAGTSRGSLRVLRELGFVEEPLEGGFSADLRLAVAAKDWRVTGTATSPGLVLGSRSLSDVVTRFEVDRDGARATVEAARHAGGSVTGLVHAAFGGRRQAAGDGVPIDLDLALDGLALETLVADATGGRNITVLSGLTSRIDGRLRYRFPSSRLLAGEGTADLELELPRSGAGLPLAGKALLRFDGGVVEATGLSLTSPGQQIAVRSLRYDLLQDRGSLHLAVDSRDLGPLAAVLVSGPRPFWLPTAGSGKAVVDLQLSPGGTTARVDLDLEKVTAPALVAERARGGFIFAGESVDDLRLELTGGGGALLVTGRVPLTDEPLALAIDAVDWPLGQLRYFLPEAAARELAGAVSGRVDLSGTGEALGGRAEVHVEGLAVSGRPVGRAEGELTFQGSAVILDRAVLETAGGPVVARGRFGLDTGEVDLSVQAPSLSLAEEPVASFVPGLTGSVSLGAALSGTLEQPQAMVSVEGREIAYEGVAVGEEGRVSLVAHLADGALQGSLDARGLARLEGSGTLDRKGARFDGSLSTGELAAVARVLGQAVPADLAGSLAGRFSFSADFAAGDWHGRVEIPAVKVAAAGHTLENLEPVVVEVSPEAVTIGSLYLSEAATESEIFAKGTLGLSRGRPLDVSLQVSGSAGWAEVLLPPGSEVRGAVELLATVRGTLRKPAITGQGRLIDGRLFLPGFPQVFDDVDGLFSFEEDRLELEQLRARLGGGTLQAAGSMALPGEGRQAGSYRLTVIAENVSLRYPAGVNSRGNAEIVLASSAGGRQVTGLIDLERALYVEDFAVSTIDLLRSFFERQRQVVEETDSLLATTQLNVLIRGPGAMRIRNNLADLTGDVDLTLRGTAARPVVFGRLEALEGGTIVWNDASYELQRATVTFNNPYRIEPIFDLVATTEVKSFDITLTVEGPLEKLRTGFSSNADLADLEILSLLTTGDRPSEAPVTPGQPVAPGALAQQFLYGQAASALTKRVGTLFGFDRFRIDPLAGAGQTVSSVGVTVGKRLSRDVFVTYSSEPTSDRNYVVQVEWQVSRKVTLVLTQAGDGSYAVDAQWERRF